MTKLEYKEVVRVCGPNFEQEDIPTFIRRRESHRIKNLSRIGRREGRKIFNGMLNEVGISLKTKVE